MSTALQICASAYRQANLDQDLTTFSTTQEFPYNIALDLINTVIQEINRQGHYWFSQTITPVTYASGIYQINLASYPIDPKAIIRIRCETANQWTTLTQVNWKLFQKRYRNAAIITGKPTCWSKYANTVELNVIPDQDYGITLYHYIDLPLVVNSTDTLLVPISDEDIVREGVYAYLLARMGHPAFQLAYQLYQTKLQVLLAEQKRDVGIAQQLPANF